MTNEIIQLSDGELLDRIKQLNLSQKQISQRLRRGQCIPEIQELISRTSFLDSEFATTVPTMARIFCLSNNISEFPQCSNPNCTNRVKWRNGVNAFSPYCCHKCAISDKAYWDRVHKTMVEKHGGVGLQSVEIRKKAHATNVNLYGSESPFGNVDIQKKAKETCLKKYGVECSLLSDEVRNKILRTTMERYHVSHYSKSNMFKTSIQMAWNQKTPDELEQIKNKRKETTFNKYGVYNVFQSQQFKNKLKGIIFGKFGVENPMQSDEVKYKFKSTMISKYGGIGMGSKQIREKIKSTTISRYGVCYSTMSEEVKKRIKETFMRNYDVDNPGKAECVKEKIRDTCLRKYGYECAISSPEIRRKIRETILLRYGVEHYSQSYEYHKNKKHKFNSEKYPDLTFDSTWEVKVYEFCRDRNIPVEYSPQISFEYEYCGKKHTYHPDFLINGKVYEVKGDQFFDDNGCMINPFDRTKDNLYEQKHVCMISNGVEILRGKDILGNLKLKI